MHYKLINPINNNLSIQEQILFNRGIKNPTEFLIKTQLPREKNNSNPELLINLIDGIKLLMRHMLKPKGKIYIQVDEDCDGYTSSAILINYLFKAFPVIAENKIIYGVHEEKAHGIDINNIEENVTLIICPDSSSNDIELHKYYKDNNIDILVIDHHQITKKSEYACIINNQDGTFPTTSLSGAGVVYKFCQALDKYNNTNYAENYLDLASLGIIADVMDLRQIETMNIVLEGLKQINNPFFNAIIEKNNFVMGNEITPFGVAFYIAPLINAVARIGTKEERLVLLESMLDHKAFTSISSTKRGEKDKKELIVTQAVRMCTNVKKRQDSNRDKAVEDIENIIKNCDLLKNKALIICIPNSLNVDNSLRGLIANQLMGKYSRPVFMLTNTKDDLWEGSVRNSNKSPISDFRTYLLNSNLVEYAEGHNSAFGIGIQTKNIELLLNKINNDLKDYDFSPIYEVDFIYSNCPKSQDLIDNASLRYYWGQGISQSLIAIENISITSNNIILMSKDKHPTLKITIGNIEFIKFKSNEEEFNKLYSQSGRKIINIIGECRLNTWNGTIRPQVVIKDYEIISSDKYYF